LFQKGGRQTKEKFSSLSSFLDTEAITQRKKEYRVLFTATRSIAQTNALREREREREMRKSRGVTAKKKTASSFSQRYHHHHHRTPLGEINNEEDEQRQEKDSPMTVRRKWNKEHGVLCGGNSPSSARFKATAMDKVLILNRRVDTLEVRTIRLLKCRPLLL
jgi:hypothetical protein